MNKTIELIKLAYPIFFSFLLEIIFGFFDKMIIGRTNINAFNAVSFMTSFLYVIVGALGIITTCFNIIYNKEKKKETINVYLTFTLILGILCELIFIFLGKNIISVLYNLDEVSLNYAYQYLIVAGPTVLFNLWIFIFSCYFRSNNNTKIQAKVTFLSLLVNLCIDYILVFGLFDFKGIGVVGCAVGTTVGLLLGLIVYLVNYKEKINIKINFIELKKLFKLYFPLLIDELFNSSILTLFITSTVSKFDQSIIGAYNVVETINSALILVTYAYSSAALTKALQTKDITYQKITIIVSLLIQGILSILIIMFSSFVTSIITSQESIISIIHVYILLGVLSNLIMCLVIPYKEVLQGFNCEKFVALVTIIYVTSYIVLILLLKEIKLLNLNSIYLVNCILNLNIYIVYKIKVKKLDISNNLTH